MQFVNVSDTSLTSIIMSCLTTFFRPEKCPTRLMQSQESDGFNRFDFTCLNITGVLDTITFHHWALNIGLAK